MQCFQFETMRRWLRARLRARGFPVADDNLAVDEVLSAPAFQTVVDVIRLDDAALDRIASQLGYEHRAAA